MNAARHSNKFIILLAYLSGWRAIPASTFFPLTNYRQTMNPATTGRWVCYLAYAPRNRPRDVVVINVNIRVLITALFVAALLLTAVFVRLFLAIERPSKSVLVSTASITHLARPEVPDTVQSPRPGPNPNPGPKPVPKPQYSAVQLEFDTPNAKRDSAYIRRFQLVAIYEMKKYGVPASISMAQGLLESTAGESDLAALHHNHFGMKCFQRGCAPGHCVNYADDTARDRFRRYPNAWTSWRAHSELLTNERYAPLQEYGLDYKSWAYALKRKGYATNPNYAIKLIRLIQRYRLDELDTEHLLIQ